MLFYILLVVGVLIVPLGVTIAGIIDSRSSCPEVPLTCGIVAILLAMPASFMLAIPLSVWSNHAEDISKVVAQEHRIEVQKERIQSLTQRLEDFNYPEKPNISLDADTPWATITKSITEAENKLAEAKDERAVAIRSIEARKRGPMSGVVSFVGDYE